jgi:hypothetical protein
VQIVEVTDFGVRAAAIRLQRRHTPMRIVVYAMIHMAAPAFYAEVARRLGRADVIVVEGVGGGERRRSPLISALTLSYRVMRFNRRLRLVEQDIDYAAFGVPVVCPDVTADQFTTGWRRVPPAERVLMWCLLPVVIVVRLFGGTRMLWNLEMERNDLPSSMDEDIADRHPELTDVFGGLRDDRLLDALSRLYEERGNEEIEVAVVYGAAHVPAIVHGMLARHDFRPRSGDWLTVVDR